MCFLFIQLKNYVNNLLTCDFESVSPDILLGKLEICTTASPWLTRFHLARFLKESPVSLCLPLFVPFDKSFVKIAYILTTYGSVIVYAPQTQLSLGNS